MFQKNNTDCNHGGEALLRGEGDAFTDKQGGGNRNRPGSGPPGRSGARLTAFGASTPRLALPGGPRHPACVTGETTPAGAAHPRTQTGEPTMRRAKFLALVLCA